MEAALLLLLAALLRSMLLRCCCACVSDRCVIREALYCRPQKPFGVSRLSIYFDSHLINSIYFGLLAAKNRDGYLEEDLDYLG